MFTLPGPSGTTHGLDLLRCAPTLRSPGACRHMSRLGSTFSQHDEPPSPLIVNAYCWHRAAVLAPISTWRGWDIGLHDSLKLISSSITGNLLPVSVQLLFFCPVCIPLLLLCLTFKLILLLLSFLGCSF
jgi:hypothetical protein